MKKREEGVLEAEGEKRRRRREEEQNKEREMRRERRMKKKEEQEHKKVEDDFFCMSFDNLGIKDMDLIAIEDLFLQEYVSCS
jgi:hypothetical protein